MIFNISLIIVLLCTFSILETDHVLPINKHEILGWHNYYRRTMPAKTMVEMSWNDSLAAHALEYAKECFYAFPRYHPREVRQNRGYGKGETYNKSIKAYLEVWMSESKYYSFQDETCTPETACQMFHAMIRWDHDKVGCIRYHCNSLFAPEMGNSYNASFFICEYTSIHENLRGLTLRPYADGVDCTDCPPEYPKCGNGLCIADDALPLIDPFDVITAHNNLRKMQRASNMLEMTWDDALHEAALEDVSSCQMFGSAFRKNRYFVIGDTILYKHAIKSWILSNSSSIKIVKWDHNMVGCAVKYCLEFKKYYSEVQNVSFFSCHYGSSSDLEANDQLFSNGTSCSNCLPNYNFCHDHLCSNYKIEMEVRELDPNIYDEFIENTATSSTSTGGGGGIDTDTGGAAVDRAGCSKINFHKILVALADALVYLL